MCGPLRPSFRRSAGAAAPARPRRGRPRAAAPAPRGRAASGRSPKRRSAASTSGSARLSLKARFSRATTGAGVPAGANRANQPLPGQSCADAQLRRSVGTSGKASQRSAPTVGQCPQPPGLDMRRGDRVDDQVAVAGDDAGRRRGAAREGHVHRIEAALVGQQRAAQMAGRADARRGVVQLARMPPAIGDQLRHAVHRQAGIHRDEAVGLAGRGDRGEAAERIVAHRVQVRRDGQVAGRGVQQRVAVRLGLGDERGRRPRRRRRPGSPPPRAGRAAAAARAPWCGRRCRWWRPAGRADVADRAFREALPAAARQAKGTARPAPSNARRVAVARRRSSRAAPGSGGEAGRVGEARHAQSAEQAASDEGRAEGEPDHGAASPARAARPAASCAASIAGACIRAHCTSRHGVPAGWRGHARGCRRAACTAPPRAPRSRR